MSVEEKRNKVFELAYKKYIARKEGKPEEQVATINLDTMSMPEHEALMKSIHDVDILEAEEELFPGENIF